MDQTAAKQQIVEKLKQANNVLVTVNNNPTVDQLAACIGVTLFLNKLNKHATAVFSGQIPSTIEFLQPEKTIEANTDSLRDFIISLDKAKADKIRYKIEDQFVRIYITPYRTSINQGDLVFSEGDFNVEAVLALGVHDRAQLDAAITTHGRILHDATVISINTGQNTAASLGQINWHDASASSLCEMLVSISEAFGASLIDNQMATAFLTGIVAETERFSNKKTSPKVMTMSAQLMAAGANQQLIISKLEPPPEAPTPTQPKPPAPSGPPDILNIPHDDPTKNGHNKEDQANEIRIDEHGNIVSSQAQKPAPKPAPAAKAQTPAVPAAKLPPVALLDKPKTPTTPTTHVEPEVVDLKPAAPPPDGVAGVGLEPEPKSEAPKPSEVHHELLTPLDHRPSFISAFTADTEPEWADVERKAPLDVLSDTAANTVNNTGILKKVKPASSAPMPKMELLPSDPAVRALEHSQDKSLDLPPPPATSAPAPTGNTARSAVNAAIASAPYDPEFEGPIVALNAQPLSDNLHPEPEPSLPKDTQLPKPTARDLPKPAPSQPAANPATTVQADTTSMMSSPGQALASDLLKPSPPPPVPPPLPLNSAPAMASSMANPNTSGLSLLKPL